jgi:DNA-binding NarL/FixJ family response regulator
VDPSPSIQLALSHPYVRVGLTHILEEAGHKAVPIGLSELDVDEPPPDLTIVGGGLQPREGLTWAADLREAHRHHPVLVLLPPDQRSLGEQAIQDGINGYFFLDQNGSDVIEACRTVLDGQIYRPPMARDDRDGAS